ncbi:hypothetical protein GPALN_005462 [Globodera pallida]|nr:hypothetical protein GPALN_005462 [Globodera pallida]
MMFAVADLSAATGGCMTGNAQRMPKVRYGSYFSAVVGHKWGENDEMKVLKRMKRAEDRLKGKEVEQREGEQRGKAKRLVGKLAKLLTVGDLPFLPSRKTVSSRGKAKKLNNTKKLLQLQQQRSHNSSQSSLFEPMPTIVEETDRELVEQQQQMVGVETGVQFGRPGEGGDQMEDEEEEAEVKENEREERKQCDEWWTTANAGKKLHDNIFSNPQQFSTAPPMLQLQAAA